MSHDTKPDFERFSSALKILSQQGALMAAAADHNSFKDLADVLASIQNDMIDLRDQITELRQTADEMPEDSHDTGTDNPVSFKRAVSERINTEARAQNARLYNSNDGKIIIPLRTEQDTPIPGFPNDMARLNEMKETELTNLLVRCGLAEAAETAQNTFEPEDYMRARFLEYIGAVDRGS